MRFVGISFISFVFCATAWLLHSPLAATEKSGYTIDVVSAGYKDENFARIIINGRDYSANERGYNVAVINPQTGEIVSRSFDTYLEPAEDMARFLFSLADGSIIAIAVKDEASWHADWRQSDVRFMTLLGAGTSGCPVEIGYRDSWALITKKVPSRDLLPSWFRCSHKASTQGIASASASFDITESATNSAESLTDSIVVNATIESPLPEIYTATDTMETTTTMTVTGDYAIEVASAGHDDGNFARIIINGRDYSANERGYNVAVINPQTGEIVARSFDTYLHPAATMTDFLYSLAAGSIIVIAVRDEASWHADWRQRDVRLMTLLGAGSSDCPVEIGYRHSFALVTKKVARRELLPSWARCDHKPSSQGMASLSVAIEITGEEFANGTSTEQEGETSEYPSVPPVDPLRAEEVIEILAHLSHPEARCLSNCHCSKLQLLHAACIEGQCDPTLLGNLSSEYPQLNQQLLASLYDSDLDIISCRGCVDRCLDRTGVCGFPNPGWKYMITPSLQGWNESREWCQNNFGGDLAYIGISNYKMRLKVAAALHFPTGSAWLGLSDLGSEGEWKWIDGTPVDDSSAKWATGEPNNWRKIEHCGAFYNKMYYEMYNITTSGTHLLNDAPCDWRYPAVCGAPCTSADAAE